MPHLVEARIENIDVSEVPDESWAGLLEAYHAFGGGPLEPHRLGGVSCGFYGRRTSLERARDWPARSERAGWRCGRRCPTSTRFLPRLLAQVSDDHGNSDEEPARVCAVVGTASVALTHVLEAAEIRIQRERADTVFHMTYILVHEQLQNRVGTADTASRMLLNSPRPVDAEWLFRISCLITGSLDDARVDRIVDFLGALSGDVPSQYAPPPNAASAPGTIP